MVTAARTMSETGGSEGRTPAESDPRRVEEDADGECPPEGDRGAEGDRAPVNEMGRRLHGDAARYAAGAARPKMASRSIRTKVFVYAGRGSPPEFASVRGKPT